MESFLLNARKEDLILLSHQLGRFPPKSHTKLQIINLIKENGAFEEESVKVRLDAIISGRLLREGKLRRELEIERLQSQLERLKLGNERKNLPPSADGQDHACELSKLMHKFDSKQDDIHQFLSLFEKQAQRTAVPKRTWISSLIPLLPSDVVHLVNHELENNCGDYEYIKAKIIEKFETSPEILRERFVRDERHPGESWREFTVRLTDYFHGWTSRLKITDFDGLKDLMISNELKNRVPSEVQEQLGDTWTRLNSPSQLAAMLDECESCVAND